MKAKLEAGGLRVKLLNQKNLHHIKNMMNILEQKQQKELDSTLHFDAGEDASGNIAGTGFLTRVRAGDVEDAAFAAPIQAFEDFQAENTNLGRLGQMDTVSNATVNAGAESPAALLELGIMVWWEKHYGKNFTETDKFDELITGVLDVETTTPRQPEPNHPTTTSCTISYHLFLKILVSMQCRLLVNWIYSEYTIVEFTQSNQTTAVPQLSSSAPQLDVNFLDIIEFDNLVG